MQSPRDGSSMSSAIIVLDPAHGLRDASGTAIDSGNVGPGGLEEGEVTLSVAALLRRLIQQAGGQVLMTRTPEQPWRVGADSRTDNLARGEMANQAGAHLLLRLHCDASTDRTSRGCRATYYREDSIPMAQAVLDGLAEATGCSRLGVFQRHEYGLDVCEAPAVSVNLGIISNAQDERLLGADVFRERAAEGLFRGLEAALAGPSPDTGAAFGEELPPTALETCLAEAGERLLRDVLAIANRTSSHVGFVARNLQTGEATWVRADTSFPAMELVGLAVMAEVTRQLREGTVHPTTTPSGSRRNILELTQAMILEGDKHATDTLIENLGAESINATASLLGLADTIVRRKPTDAAALAAGVDNLTTPGDVAHILEQIAVGQSVSGEASKAMYAMLQRHSRGELIRSGVSPDAEVANISGSQTGAEADAAIVRAPHATYVLSVFFRDVPDVVPAVASADLIREISAAVYQHYARAYVWVATDTPGHKVLVNGHVKGISPCLVQITSATQVPQEFVIAAESEDGRRAETTVTVKQGSREAAELSLR